MQTRHIARLVVVASTAVAALAGADTINLPLNVGPVMGGPTDSRTPGNGNWWLPDNAATSGEVRAGVGHGGGNGLVVGNRGNGNDGVIHGVLTPQLNERAGETGFNDAGNDTFISSYRFRTASTTAVADLDFKTETWGPDRTTWLDVYEDGGALKVNYSGVDSNGGGTNAEIFTDNFFSGTLNWGDWYRVETVVRFVDGAGNDTVNVKLYDDNNNLLWDINDTTWESYYRQDTEQLGNGNQIFGVNALSFQARYSPAGDVAYVSDITYSSVPTPGAAAALGLAGLVGLRRRR